MEKLLELQTGELLRKFGMGSHKPGSGSAVALQGLLSAQLLRTVINLSIDPKRAEIYGQFHPEFLRIDSEITGRIYPALEHLFQLDSEEFDKVIKLRIKRDDEENAFKKNIIRKELVQATKVATETLIEIAGLCVELADFASFVFENGFKTARGDSSVALNDVVSAVGGCLSIINLNLLSLGIDDWTKGVEIEIDKLSLAYPSLLIKSSEAVSTLDREAASHKLFQEEKQRLQSGLWLDKNLSNSDIEKVARDVQLTLWRNKKSIWKKRDVDNPIDALRPDVVLEKLLGYDFERETSLGLHEVNGELYEIAGFIDKKEKLVAISEQFPLQTQNFTAAHELGHLLLHGELLLHRDKPLDGSSNISRDIKEYQADKFASYFLMPKKQVEAVFKELFLDDKFVLNEETAFRLNEKSVSLLRNKVKDLRGLSKYVAETEFFAGRSLISLANIFQVSTTTMAIRLEELNLVIF